MGKLLSQLIAIAVTLTIALPAFAQPIFSHSLDPDTRIISYSVTSEMLEDPDLIPRIQVYGDGRVWVHYPNYMTKAGDYETWLNQGELRQLLLVLSGVFDFDPIAVKRSRKLIKEAREQQTGRLQHHSDDTSEQIEVVLDTYQSNAKAVAKKIDMKLSWKNIAIDATEYPELTSIQKLNGARNSVRALLSRSDLARIGGEKTND